MTVHSKKAAKRHRRTVSEKEETIKSILRALPVTAGVGLLLLFITTALLMQTGDPHRYHAATGYALVYVTAFVGAFAAVRLNHRRAPLLCGLGEGLILLILVTAVGLCMPDTLKGGLATGASLLMHAMLLPASLLGAFAAARQSKKRHRRRH